MKYVDRHGFEYWFDENKISLEGFRDRLYSGGWTNFLTREDGGPTFITPDGNKWWYHYGKMHREDGPALIKKSMDRFYPVYYLNDERVTFDEFLEKSAYFKDDSERIEYKLSLILD